MAYRKWFLGLLILCFSLVSLGFAEDYDLQYFLSKASSKAEELSKKEKIELLSRIDRTMEQAQRIQMKLSQVIQTEEMEIRYQDGKFWMSRLEKDKASIQTGLEQIKLLKEKPTYLVASIILYKTLKDLSADFNTYNNVPSFSALVGDLAPEMELWADPVFYKLYLLPIARSKDKGMGKERPQPQKEKKLTTQGKKP